MKQIIGAFSTLLVLVIVIVGCVSVITVSGNVANAKEYKADVVAEIENSNFNPEVIDSCVSQAHDAGYSIEIKNCMYDELNNIQTAEIVLTYHYKIPILESSRQRQQEELHDNKDVVG